MKKNQNKLIALMILVFFISHCGMGKNVKFFQTDKKNEIEIPILTLNPIPEPPPSFPPNIEIDSESGPESEYDSDLSHIQDIPDDPAIINKKTLSLTLSQGPIVINESKELPALEQTIKTEQGRRVSPAKAVLALTRVEARLMEVGLNPGSNLVDLEEFIDSYEDDEFTLSDEDEFFSLDDLMAVDASSIEEAFDVLRQRKKRGESRAIVAPPVPETFQTSHSEILLSQGAPVHALAELKVDPDTTPLDTSEFVYLSDSIENKRDEEKISALLKFVRRVKAYLLSRAS